MLTLPLRSLFLVYRNEEVLALWRSRLAHFHKVGIEGWSAADIGQPFRGQCVHVGAVGGVLVPAQTHRHHASLNPRPESEPQAQRSAIVEELHPVAVL